MKKLVLILIAILFAAAEAATAPLFPATGCVVNTQGQPVEYATVVLLRGTEQVAGMATNSEGQFSLKVPAGDYTLLIQYLGYDPLKRTVRIEQDNNLGRFEMKSSATQIEGVVVRGQLIRREADRFVVDVANAVSAIGKDGIELLEYAPGVWIDGEKISINGKSGSKVYVNDRELKMDNAQLLVYLRSLRAENILKIEVVPTAGAEYDADTSGGVIKITLRKRRENGTQGNVSFTTRQGEFTHRYSPHLTVSHHAGSLDLNASAWATFDRMKFLSDEKTVYTGSDNSLVAHSQLKGSERNFGVDLGAIYALNDRHSFGVQVEYWRNRDKSGNDSWTDFLSGDALTRTVSRYDTRDIRNNYSARFNYIWKVDSLGSTFKVLVDYDRRESEIPNLNRSVVTTAQAVRDSLYRDRSASTYNVTAAAAAYEKYFSPRWSLNTGIKYTYNDMRNDALYEYMQNEAWMRNDNQSFGVDYTEHITAAYATARAQLGRWSLAAGLRAEYTHTYGKEEGIGQDYFSLFPNANVAFKLDRKGDYSLIAQYARTIERPRFWSLNPRRTQISDYTYQTGNPQLDPAYMQDMSLTFVLARKYTLTAGVTLKTGEIQQSMWPDEEDPDKLQLGWLNFDRTSNYYLSANLPFQPTRWWVLNLNASYMYWGQRIAPHDPQINQHVGAINASTTFTLPVGFYIDLSYGHTTKIQFGNCWAEPTNRLTAGVKKRFGDKFSASFSVRNILDQGQRIGASGQGFVRTVKVREHWNCRSYQIGLTYNFKSGKAFKRKSVEQAAGDQKSRL